MTSITQTPLTDLSTALLRAAIGAACGHRGTTPASHRLADIVESVGPTILLELVATTPSPSRYQPPPDPSTLSAIAMALLIGGIGDTGLPEHRDIREQLIDLLLEAHGWTLSAAATIAVNGCTTITPTTAAARAHLATALAICRDYIVDL